MLRLADRIEALIATGNDLAPLWQSEVHPEPVVLERATDMARWIRSSEHFLEYVGLPSFLERFSRTYAAVNVRMPYKVAQLIGILESARDEIALGFLGRIIYLAHADLFGSVIEQADALLSQSHTVPAAVLGRIVIEGWLRDEAERNAIPEHDTAKASVLNDRLKGASVFAIPRWRLIQGYLDVGNAAAHGKVEEVTPSDITQMLAFARTNCV